jgi:CHAD domain-containing protein
MMLEATAIVLPGDDGASNLLAITKDTPVGEAFARIVQACRTATRKHRATLLSTDDPEGVHQTRVALRRLRAAIAFFRDVIDDPGLAAIDRQARRLAKDCGAARDLDVFLTQTVPDAPPEVRRIGQQLASSGLQRAREALSGDEFDAFDCSLQRLAGRVLRPGGETIETFAGRKLEDFRRRVRRRGRHISKLGPMHLHRLRMATKRLRYAAMFLAPAFEPDAAAYIEATETLQDALGALNDRSVGKKVLAGIAAAAEPSKRAQARCKSLKRRPAEEAKDRHRIKKAWTLFKNAEPFWRSRNECHGSGWSSAVTWELCRCHIRRSSSQCDTKTGMVIAACTVRLTPCLGDRRRPSVNS